MTIQRIQAQNVAEVAVEVKIPKFNLVKALRKQAQEQIDKVQLLKVGHQSGILESLRPRPGESGVVKKSFVMAELLKFYSQEEYEDMSCKRFSTDIYELSKTEIIAELDLDSEDSTMVEVVNFFTNQRSGAIFPKFAEIQVREYFEDDETKVVGSPVKVDLAQFAFQNQKQQSYFFEDGDKSVKVDLILTVRETSSEVTSKEKGDSDEDSSESEEVQDSSDEDQTVASSQDQRQAVVKNNIIQKILGSNSELEDEISDIQKEIDRLHEEHRPPKKLEGGVDSLDDFRF